MENAPKPASTKAVARYVSHSRSPNLKAPPWIRITPGCGVGEPGRYASSFNGTPPGDAYVIPSSTRGWTGTGADGPPEFPPVHALALIAMPKAKRRGACLPIGWPRRPLALGRVRSVTRPDT